MSKLCFIGIGNPGAKYNETKHNIGKDWLNRICNELNLEFVLKEKLEAKIAISSHDNFLLAIPTNFVNNTGKTIQTAAFIHYLHHHQNVRGPFLVVAPLSVMINWHRELQSWTDLDVVVSAVLMCVSVV